jgi:hypothetical protein
MTRYLLMLAFTPAIFGQSSETTLTQTLVNEIHALRQDIEAITVASQRVQIALYRLQSQTALMAAAQQRLDAARIRTKDVQSARTETENRLHTFEETVQGTQDPVQKKAFEQELQQGKLRLEQLITEEGQRHSAEAEAESQFRAEQARLADLQALLDRLDKALDDLSRTKH